MSAPLLGGLLLSGGAGALAGRLLRLPLAPLLGAIVGSSLFHVAVGGGGTLPGWWVFVAQVAVGSAVGSRLGPRVLHDFREILLPGMLVVLVLVPAGIALGLAVWTTHKTGLVESVFGLVPGGVGEMVAAVTSLDGDGALVAGMHVVRLVVVLSVLPLVVRWMRRRGTGEE
ncbi:MAG: AbrB family transcriptional regulator [Actinomycetes bacterium]